MAGFQTVRTGVAAASNDSAYAGAPISRQADIAFGATLLAVFGGSAIYGYIETGRCAAARDRINLQMPVVPSSAPTSTQAGPPEPEASPSAQSPRVPEATAPAEPTAPPEPSAPAEPTEPAESSDAGAPDASVADAASDDGEGGAAESGILGSGILRNAPF